MERRKLFLSVGHLLQGSFHLHELNLLFIFQLDCPGLYSYGIPQANALYRQYNQQGLQVLGLSTAFDNPQFNTAQNTRLLLLNHVSNTASEYPTGESVSNLQAIDFPVAYDRLVSQASFEKEHWNAFWQHQRWSFQHGDTTFLPELQHEILPFIRRFDLVPLTFLFNVFIGVPGWVLFDRHLNIIYRWYGFRPLSETELLIAHWLENRPPAVPTNCTHFDSEGG